MLRTTTTFLTRVATRSAHAAGSAIVSARDLDINDAPWLEIGPTFWALVSCSV